MLLKTWQRINSRKGLGWVIVSGTFANREVGDRAYMEVLVACPRNNYPSQAPHRVNPGPTYSPISLGALLRISYAAFMRETTDEQLMQRYANGDAPAFDQLYARHRGPLYRYFNRQVNDAATANDLYQGAWEKIIKARRKYRPSAPFTVWMYRIAHNHMVDHYRRSRPVDSLETETLSDDRPGPAQGMVDGEQNEQLRAAISALPVEQRNTLLLKLETGLKMEDIARVTGVSRETVKSRLRYAVNKLKQVLIE
jgi:RNA polymerase sigma factor (sigma-70 family)